MFTLSTIDTVLNLYENDLKIPGFDFVLYHDGECIYRRFAGHSDYEGKVKMTGKERYNAYSASKLITCTAALKLFESGAYKLHDPLCAYLPEFAEMSVLRGGEKVKAKKQIKIKDLFTMTAGFTYNTESDGIKAAKAATGGLCPTRKVMEYLAQDPLIFEPGEGWCYSLCHDVLAAFVEVVSGERFGEYVRKNVFLPLGMTHSTYSLPEEEVESLMAQYFYNSETKQYERRECGQHIHSFKFGPLYESGGAGCITSVDDHIKLDEALRIGDVILKEETVRMMTSNQLTEYPHHQYQRSLERLAGYGYGLGCYCSAGIAGREDFGWTGAAGAFHCVNRKYGYSAYFAEQVLNAPNFPTSMPLRDRIADIFINERFK